MKQKSIAEKMLRETTLRQYQEQDIQEILYLLQHFNQVAMIGPTGCGKTLETRALVASLLKQDPMLRPLVASTMEHIMDGFISKDEDGNPVDEIICPPADGKEVARSILDLPVKLFRLSKMVEGKNVKDLRKTKTNDIYRFLNQKAAPGHALVVSHQVLAYQENNAKLLPKDCSNILLIVDEGHHGDYGVNGIGKFVKLVGDRDGRILLLTALAYRTDGVYARSIVAKSAMVERTMREHQKQGYAPENVDIAYVTVDEVTAKSSRDIVRSEGNPIKVKEEEPYANAFVRKYVDDGKAKSVFIIPRARKAGDSENLAKKIIERLVIAGVPKERILNAVGSSDAKKHEVVEALGSDKYGIKYDVIIGCRRFNEGMDWPSGTHVYILGMSRNVGLFYNRVGRVMRLRDEIWEKNKALHALYADKDTYVKHSKVTVFVPDYNGDEDGMGDAECKQVLLNTLVGVEFEAFLNLSPMSSEYKKKLRSNDKTRVLTKEETLFASELSKICHIPDPIAKDILIDVILEKKSMEGKGVDNVDITRTIFDMVPTLVDKYSVEEKTIQTFLVGVLDPSLSCAVAVQVAKKTKARRVNMQFSVADEFEACMDEAIQELKKKGMSLKNLVLYVERSFKSSSVAVCKIVDKLVRAVDDQCAAKMTLLTEKFIEEQVVEGQTERRALVAVNCMTEHNAPTGYAALGRWMDSLRVAERAGVKFTPDERARDLMSEAFKT